ncbi:MAG: protein kinase [Pseudomonadota bacterium]|nr:protein kinase [Pseudomonadota bacterium]
MVSLVNVLRSFQTGSLSRDELFAEVDQILQGGRVNESWLLKTLEEENTKVPLPEDIREVVHNRIERAAEIKQGNKNGGVESGVNGDQFVDPDESRTRLATSLYLNEAGSSDAGKEVGSAAPPRLDTGTSSAPETERMKGKGDVLNNRFVLEECIGTGGMSTVYKALDRRKLEANDRYPYVAVKVLNLEFRAHPDSLIALQREAKKSQSLAHPNIVRVYDFDRDGPTVYMTMEYLSGEPLAQILRAPGFKGLPGNEVMRILEGIARALIFAHSNGIIHADFKPANVILTDKGEVKVIDFGIARAFKRPDDSDMEVTRFDPGSLGALTPTYASPEMLEQQKPDPRDDVYALACIAYEMLTGRHPFGRMQATEARDGGLEPERRKNLTRRQWKALKSALAFDRDKRTANVQQFLNEFRPESSLSVPVPVYAIGKALMVILLAGIAYYYGVAGIIEQYFVGREEVADAADAELIGDVEIASLQAPEHQQPMQSPASRKFENPEHTIPPGGTDQSSTQGQLAKMSEPVQAEPINNSLPELSLEAVMPVLDQLPCSAFNVSVREGAVDLQGYVSRQLDIKRLEKQILALPGAKKLSSNLKQVVDAKCPIVELYAPYWSSSGAGHNSLTVQSRGKVNELIEGEPLVVEIKTPPYESYVNVDYYSLDGGVVHMIPGPRARDNQAPPNYAATIGDLGEWTVSEPFGEEMVAVLMTPEPLFDQLRDEYETNSDYLAAVREQLARITKESGKDKITADFVMINTKPKSLMEKLKTLGQP